MELKVCFLGAVRRRTFICCRNVRISASSAARDRNRSTTIQTMSLTRSRIPRQHRPILDQLLVRLSLRQGHRPERNRTARSFRQLRRFHHAINSDKDFVTHTPRPTRRFRDAVLAREIGGLRARLMFPQHANNLLSDSNSAWTKFAVAGQRISLIPSRTTTSKSTE